jgi:CelD/BcsL family acetyltransferase involved in cellulose biosynthesis
MDYVRFHNEVAERFHRRGQLLLIQLEVDGQVIASRYDFAYGGKGWCFQGGWLPEAEKLRPGRTMMAHQMRCCIEHGLQEYDFLGGQASYKGEWSEAERGMVDLSGRNPSSWRGWLFEAAKFLKQRLRPTK